ncbi:Uncharacterised protein [Serratia fonticola]|uniref:Uncharacterized protein n=1 Tax=Serratia fonticola TaxID=47917 RepID=A0A4U9VY55_SERFO|nr:Uncharacterised protein [Serratia fonticola]
MILLALMAIVFSSQMTLNRQTHQVVLYEVARIKAGGKIGDIKPEVRLVIEKLVGLPYEQCWGNSKICQKMNITPEVATPVYKPA